MSVYKTVDEEAEVAIVIEKSKFIGHVIPIKWHEDSDMSKLAQEAEEFILNIRNKHKEANHNVPIYVIGNKYEVQKYSDDGEPSKTAGVPVLDMLKKEGITNVVLVITRYFGGIKLGTGGLVRAYTNTAKLALETGKVVQKVKHEIVKIRASYTSLGRIQNEMIKHGFIIKDTIFDEGVTLYVYSLLEKTDMLRDIITNITNGDGIIEIVATEYITIESELAYEKRCTININNF